MLIKNYCYVHFDQHSDNDVGLGIRGAVDCSNFVKYIDNIFLVSLDEMRKYLRLQKELFSNPLCKGLTIALEPVCCGGEDNCLLILNELCREFGLKSFSESRDLIKSAS